MPDPWDDMAAQLADIEIPEVEDVSKERNPLKLREMSDKIDDELKEREELLAPRTQRGRDLHSRRAALRITLLDVMKNLREGRGQ